LRIRSKGSADRADPPDRVTDIVGDEQGAVAGDLDTDRAAIGGAVLGDEAAEDARGDGLFPPLPRD